MLLAKKIISGRDVGEACWGSTTDQHVGLKYRGSMSDKHVEPTNQARMQKTHRKQHAGLTFDLTVYIL